MLDLTTKVYNSQLFRLVIYEYDFKSEATIYDNKIGQDKGVKTKIDAKYIFEMLHHDLDGHILARYQVYEKSLS